MPTGYPKNGLNKGWFKQKDKISYKGIHGWIIYQKGHPSFCIQCGKKGEKFNGKWSISWANKDHKYSRNLDDYIPLCYKCHRQYDIKNNNYVCHLPKDTKGKNNGNYRGGKIISICQICKRTKFGFPSQLRNLCNKCKILNRERKTNGRF